MKHLTDEQLSALLDGALSGSELAAFEAHVAGCDACRSRLADAGALDESLERSLAHDPGEAYFESFADRVAARIAAARPEAAKAPTSHRPWLLSPRGLALAGSTAALMLVAGLAWVRFHERGGTVAVLREAPPSPVGSALREQAAPEPSLQRSTPHADAVEPAPAAEAVPAPAAHAVPEPTVPPAAVAKRAPLAASNEAPAARSVAPAPAEGAVRAEEEKDSRVSAEPLAPCGSVRDSRGRAVSGAQVMVVNDVTRSARTGSDGSFCLPRLERGDELSVLRVGYEPVRLTVADAAALAVVMEPVGTLGPEAGKGLTPPGSPSALAQGSTSESTQMHNFSSPKLVAPVPDLYASQAPPVREAVAGAREAARVARRDRSADAMDTAAVRWDAVTALVTGAALHDARFQALSLRRESLGVSPTSARLARFNDGLRVFLAQAPHSLPEYATASRWKRELEPKNKALYR